MKEVENGSNGSAAGNTRIAASLYWCLTWNTYPGNWLDELKKGLNENDKYVFGKEVGESGNLHIQGFIMFSKKSRPFEKFGKLGIHWEKKSRRSSCKQAFQYCCKDGDFVTNKEEWVPYKVKIDLYDWQKKLIKILEEEPDDRTLNWIWEREGGIGKTTFQKYVFTNMEKVIVLSGKSADMKNGIIQYEEKNGCLPRIVLINIPRTSLDYVSYAGIEDIKDMFFYSGKYEGGMVCGPSPHVMIFANEEPEFGNCSADRWNVIEL